MDIFDIISLLGGLGFFLFGMNMMGNGLKSLAGSKLESILERLSGTTLRGVLLGTIVTAIIQSSSATTVMVVGFVNSGLMKLANAIGVIMGANIGTTVTGWILCLSDIGGEGSSIFLKLLKPSTFAPLMILIGTILVVFISSTKKQNIGSIILGFGTLMVGMGSMSDAAQPLAEMPAFTELLTLFSNPILGILVGTALTAVIQSASAAVGILQALSLAGILTNATVIPVTIGICIGACAPVLLSAIGANINGKRAAFTYLYFNTLGAIILTPIFYAIDAFANFAFMEQSSTLVSIALINTLFNLITTIVLFPLIKLVEKLIVVTISDRKADEDSSVDHDSKLELIDKRFLSTPIFALDQCRSVITHMVELDLYNVRTAIALQDSWDEDSARQIEKNENLSDEYEDTLGSYLVEISRHDLPEKESYRASNYIHTVGDLERISDHSINLCEIAGKINAESISFSPNAKHELDTVNSALTEILELTYTALRDMDTKAAMQIQPLEEAMDVLCAALKDRHVSRLQQGLCTVETGFVFNDLLNNYERISDHCSNIAIYVLRTGDTVFDPHKYLDDIEHKAYYESMYHEYIEKYCKSIGVHG